MRLTPDALVQKWQARFAPNDEFRITAADLQEFVLDVANTFGVVLANVPAWVAGTDYPAGYLVRYGLPGGRESFYYSLVAGQLPHPTLNQTDANWKLMPPPISEVALAQYLTLFEAGAIEGNAVVAGRRYGVVHKWNGSAADQLVYLDGLENYFRRRGTVLHDDGSQQEVDVDVAAGTYQVVGSAGGQPPQHVLVTTPNVRFNDLVLSGLVAFDGATLLNVASFAAQLLKGGLTAAASPRNGSPATVLAAIEADVAALSATDRLLYTVRFQTTPALQANVSQLVLVPTGSGAEVEAVPPHATSFIPYSASGNQPPPGFTGPVPGTSFEEDDARWQTVVGAGGSYGFDSSWSAGKVKIFNNGAGTDQVGIEVFADGILNVVAGDTVATDYLLRLYQQDRSTLLGEYRVRVATGQFGGVNSVALTISGLPPQVYWLQCVNTVGGYMCLDKFQLV